MNNLKELKPYTVIRKENTDRATAWNQFSLLPGGDTGPGGGATSLGLGGPGAAASASGLDIFTDEEFQEGDELRRGGSAAGGSMGPGMGAGGGVAAMHPLLAPASAAAAQELDPLLRSLAPPPALLRGSQPAALAALGLTAAPAATRASGLGGAAAAAAPLPAAGLSGPGKSALAPQAFGTGKLVQQPAAASAGVTAAPAPVSVTAAAPPATAYKAAASAAASAAPTAVPGPPPLHPVAAAALSAGTDVDASHFSYLGLQDGTANEMSYEELRAQAWMRRNPPHKRPASATSGPAAAVAAPASTWSQEAAAPAASLVVAQRGMAGLIIPDDDDDGENGPAVKAQKTAAAGMAVGGSSRRAFGQVLPGSGGASALSGGGGAAGGIGALGVLAGDNDEGAGIAAPTAPAPAQVADENPPTRRTLPGESGAGASVAPVTLPSLAATTRRPALGLLHDAAPAASPAAAYEHPPSAVPPQLYAPQAQLPVEPPAVQAAGPRPEPTVTISTRGAFDLLNSMFSDDLPHQQQRRVAHQPQPQPQAQPQARPAPLQARVPQFATAPVVEPAPALGMAPLQAAVPAVAAMAPAPAVAVAAAAAAPHEPTVTLHTRLAFDAINDMFSDALPHEEARRVRCRSCVRVQHVCLLSTSRLWHCWRRRCALPPPYHQRADAVAELPMPRSPAEYPRLMAAAPPPSPSPAPTYAAWPMQGVPVQARAEPWAPPLCTRRRRHCLLSPCARPVLPHRSLSTRIPSSSGQQQRRRRQRQRRRRNAAPFRARPPVSRSPISMRTRSMWGCAPPLLDTEQGWVWAAAAAAAQQAVQGSWEPSFARIRSSSPSP